MNLRKHIILIGLLLAAWITPVLAQDYVAIVCAGDTGMSYHVKGSPGSTFNWRVNGGVITRQYGDSIIVDWGMVPGEYQLRVQEISTDGCYAIPKTATVLVSGPSVELGDDSYICQGETFTLTPEGDFENLEWSDGSTSPSYTSSVEGLISIKVFDAYGCYSEDEMYLELKPLPRVDLGSDTSLCGQESLDLDGGSDGIIFEWSTGEISQFITVYQGYQEIKLRVEDEYGCVDGDTLVIEDCDLNDFFSDIPTALTPSNQDGVNDYWDLVKLQAYPDAVVDIYDRWGRLVWRSEPGYPTPWDGKNMRGKDVPMDSYHYIIRLFDDNEDRINGSVTVIR